MSQIAKNLESVRERIAAAACRSGRKADDITLIAVTKTRSVDEIKQVIDCGITDIGENYVQEAEVKFSTIGQAVRWHMIGHLQRNKAKHAVELFSLIHSVDSEQLARELGRRAQAIGKTVDVLVEVNISGEETKFGVKPEQVMAFLESIADIQGIHVCGLMGMAPIVNNAEETRPYFA